MNYSTKTFDRKMVGLGSLARLGNLSLETQSLRLRHFKKELVWEIVCLGNLSRQGKYVPADSTL